MPQAEDNSSKKEDDKKPKKKGPLRLEAIIPFSLILGLILAYGHFFFDNHFKRFLELAGSYTYGAEVNIANLDISLFEQSLLLQKVEITDIDHVERNILQIGEIRLKLNTDALLRAKFVVSDAAIEKIALHAPRQSPGRIYRSKSETKSNLNVTKKRALENTKTQLAGNVFGDAAELLDGTDPTAQLSSIRQQLQTEKKIQEVQAELEKKKKEWQARVEQLPNKDQFKKYESELKALDFNLKKPQVFAKSVKEGARIIKSADKDIRSVKADSDQLKKDLKYFENSLKEIEKAKEADIASLQERIALPELDTKSLALALFGPEVRGYVQKIEKYSALFQEYFPADESSSPSSSSSASSSSITPKERALGKTYEFPTKKSYPLFWLQKASISSDSKSSSYSGDIQGLITNFTSNPKHLGKPAVIRLQGDFPHQKVFGLNSQLTLDKTQEVAKNTLQATVRSYPVGPRNFSKSPKATFGFKKAGGSSQVVGTLVQNQLDLKVKNQLQNIDYITQSSSKNMSEFLTGLARDVPKIQVDAHLKGQWRNPGISLSSNLAQAIASSFQKQLKEKIEQAKNKVKNLVDSKVKAQKDQVQKEIDAFKNKHLGQLDQLKKDGEKAKNQLSSDLKKKQESKKSALENKAKDEVKKLFKKFKF